MKMEVASEQNGITKIVLTGSMDINGALEIDSSFKEISQTKDNVVVDLEHLDFLASLGMRTFVTSAKSLRAKGGQMVLVNPQAGVAKALKSAGIDTVIPLVPDFDAAVALFR